MVTAAHQQLALALQLTPHTGSFTWANIIWTSSVMFQLSEHFSYPNTQHVRISDLLLYKVTVYHYSSIETRQI